jgi:hypothetical protein
LYQTLRCRDVSRLNSAREIDQREFTFDVSSDETYDLSARALYPIDEAIQLGCRRVGRERERHMR